MDSPDGSEFWQAVVSAASGNLSNREARAMGIRLVRVDRRDGRARTRGVVNAPVRYSNRPVQRSRGQVYRVGARVNQGCGLSKDPSDPSGSSIAVDPCSGIQPFDAKRAAR